MYAGTFRRLNRPDLINLAPDDFTRAVCFSDFPFLAPDGFTRAVCFFALTKLAPYILKREVIFINEPHYALIIP